jgi:hypothetical protein
MVRTLLRRKCGWSTSDSERLAVVGAAKDLDGVREKVGDGVERFDRSFGTAGEIDDNAFVTDSSDPAGENGVGRLLDTFPANFFGEPGNGAIGNVDRSLGSGVARAQASAAGGEEDIRVARIGDGSKLAANCSGIVGTT